MNKSITINPCRILLLAGVLFIAAFQPILHATPYASGITNDNGTIHFHLNESGGTVVVTYEDGTTNANYNGQNTGTNLPSTYDTAGYSFSLAGHTTYSIAVSKTGIGAAGMEPNVIQTTNSSVYLTNLCLQGFGDPRGLAVDANPTSPWFGNVYVSRGGTTVAQTVLYNMYSDGSWGSAGPAGSTAGVSWVTTDFHAVSPYKISVAADGRLIVGDWANANTGVWLVDPNLVTNEVLLGPVGVGPSSGVHSGEVGRPVLLGDLNTGATLLTVDADFPTTQPGSILVYSNITASALSTGLGWQNAPDVVGPQVTLNYNQTIGQGFYFCPSLCVGPNGYVYSGEYRGGVSAGDRAAVQVYDTSITNQLWNSRYNGGNSDYFYTTAAPGNPCNPTDVAVSPDAKYLVTANADNHLTICALTNGIPDVSTIYTVRALRPGAVGSYALADEVAWDAADNIYCLSYSAYGLTSWTLGLSTLAVTTGQAAGVTAFNLTFLNPAVSVYATNNSAISQANTYGNPTNGYFTIVRSGGDLTAPLTVNFTYGGTATNGTYTAGNTGKVVLASGQTVTNILITAVTDNQPRLTTYLTMTVTPSVSYTLNGGQATMSILNTATPYLIPSAGAAKMYNAFSNDYCSVTITRWGDTNATTVVNSGNFTTAGTATNGTDYTAPSVVTFNPGDLTATAFIHPLIAGNPPVHSPTLPFTGNKTVVLGIGSGSGYTAATNTVALTIVDSATPPAPVLFSDPLTDPNDAMNWGINSANGDMGVIAPDVNVQFGCDLTATPGYGIPFPPNGSQYALCMTVNKSNGQGGFYNPMTAVNAYLTNYQFGGNYAVRFNMNVIESGSLIESGSYNNEEGPLMGINHNGQETNWWAGSNTNGSAQINVWPADGIFYWISDSGGRYDNFFSPYQEFAGRGSPATNSGWIVLGSQTSTPFATAFKTNVFTCAPSSFVPPHDPGWTEGGPGLPVNGSGSYGLSVSSWADVEIKQINGVVTFSIDKNPIFVYTNTTAFTSGFVMLGYEDPYDGGETADAAVYYSNLRVVSVGGPVISNVAMDKTHGTVLLNFAVTDDASSFTVQGATNVNGPYANVAATITPTGNGTFQTVVPQNGAIQFYRILQQ